jgi:flavodoxin
MKALVVYDSVFGNTEKVAQTIGQALADSCQGETLPVSQVTSEKLRELDILVVGSPTRGFRPIEGITRFLNGLSKEQLDGLQVAAFDTRIWLETIDSSVFRFVVDKGGYAADTIAKSLKKKGGTLVVAPEGFLVTGEEGPLKEGELERAAAWAGKLFAG